MATTNTPDRITLAVSVLAIFAAIGGPFTAWGVTQARLKEIESKQAASKADSDLVKKHEAIYPLIQRDVTDIKTSQIAFNEKYDRNREEDQKVIREILRAVKA